MRRFFAAATLWGADGVGRHAGTLTVSPGCAIAAPWLSSSDSTVARLLTHSLSSAAVMLSTSAALSHKSVHENSAMSVRRNI